MVRSHSDKQLRLIKVRKFPIWRISLGRDRVGSVCQDVGVGSFRVYLIQDNRWEHVASLDAARTNALRRLRGRRTESYRMFVRRT